MTAAELKAIRLALDLTPLEFGRALGYDGTDQAINVQVWRYESGRRKVPPYIARLVSIYRDNPHLIFHFSL